MTKTKVFLAAILLSACTTQVIDERHVKHCLKMGYAAEGGAGAGGSDGSGGGADAGP